MQYAHSFNPRCVGGEDCLICVKLRHQLTEALDKLTEARDLIDVHEGSIGNLHKEIARLKEAATPTEV